MDELTIKYKIDDITDISNLYELEGGIYVEYNNVVLTKALNSEEDDGYIGNFLFSELWQWMEGIPVLITAKPFRIYIAEIFMAFKFEPKNDLINFSVISGTTSDEKELGIYSEYPRYNKNGWPIPPKLFYNESIKLGREFLKDVTENYSWLSQHDEIEKFRNTLINAEEAVDKYNKTH